MSGSPLAFAEGRRKRIRKRREKGEIGPQRDRKARINQRLPFLAFFVVLLFFDAMVGSNSSWGQAPLMESDVPVSNLKHAPGIPRRVTNRLPSETLRGSGPCGPRHGSQTGLGLYLHAGTRLPHRR